MYGAEYKAWVEQASAHLRSIDPNRDAPLFVRFHGRPLRFLKQVVSMFASVNDDTFREHHRELADFVLDPECRLLPVRYAIDMRLVRGRFSRFSGFYASIDLERRVKEVASEVAYPPFAFRLIVGDAKQVRPGAIEWFATYAADEVANLWVWTRGGHIESKFPGDYRSRASLERDAAEAKDAGNADEGSSHG